MYKLNIRVDVWRILALLVMTAAGMDSIHAYVKNDEVEINGIRYRTSYYRIVKNCIDPVETGDFPDWEKQYSLENETKRLLDDTMNLCQTATGPEVFHFYDGSEIPGFLYPVVVMKNNINYRPLPVETVEGKELSKRDPYYRGDVWLEDSVPLKDLPNLRKTKYQYVCDMDNDIFQELTSIRTPKYMVLRENMFAEHPMLHTVRIGAAQLVDSFAFKDCTNLETVIFESSPFVQFYAFDGCPNIKYVIMEGKLPKPSDDALPGYTWDSRNPFSKNVYEEAILYVHEDQIEAFRKDKTWGRFKNIRDIEEYYAGVKNVDMNSTVEYQVFDLSGAMVRSVRTGENWREGLPGGVYIVKSSLGSVRKELIK